MDVREKKIAERSADRSSMSHSLIRVRITPLTFRVSPLSPRGCFSPRYASDAAVHEVRGEGETVGSAKESKHSAANLRQLLRRPRVA